MPKKKTEKRDEALCEETKRSGRKKRVLQEQNNSDDSDFEEKSLNNNRLRTAPTPVKRKRTKSKTNLKTTARRVSAKEKEEETEEQGGGMVWTCPTSTVQRIKRINIKKNVVTLISGYRRGIVKRSDYTAGAVRPVIENVSSMKVSQLVSPFDRRVTALAWHPTKPNLAAAGSKGGDIILWDTNQSTSDLENRRTLFKSMIQGRGPGGSIQCLKFDIENPERVFTASIDGTVTRHNFNGDDNKIYLETNDWERWYTGLDVSFSTRTMVAGNNKGIVTLMTLEGEKIWDKKLHRAKCNFVQFSERQSWMMVTTSTGAGTGSVKVWDIRNIKGPESALAELHHDKAVNSAYFSPQSGDKLLTTDQHSQLRIYQAPDFSLVRTIPHPHRQFQHLTPIKACWHPLADIVFAGRYPDPKFPGYEEGERRTVDFFCPETGELLLGLQQPGLSQIISLSQFNCAGDRMMSGMAGTVMIWRPRPPQEEEEEVKSASLATGIEGVTVEQWPDFTVKKKKQSKKTKAAAK